MGDGMKRLLGPRFANFVSPTGRRNPQPSLRASPVMNPLRHCGENKASVLTAERPRARPRVGEAPKIGYPNVPTILMRADLSFKVIG